MISFVAFAPQGSAKTYVNVITASAADSMTKPVLIKRQAYSNKIEAGVKNLTSFSPKTTFEVYVNGRYVRKYTWQALKKDNYINITNDGKLYLKAYTRYKVTVKAVNGSAKSESSVLNVKTASKTYYYIDKNVQLYSFKMVGSRNPQKQKPLWLCRVLSLPIKISVWQVRTRISAEQIMSLSMKVTIRVSTSR